MHEVEGTVHMLSRAGRPRYLAFDQSRRPAITSAGGGAGKKREGRALMACGDGQCRPGIVFTVVFNGWGVFIFSYDTVTLKLVLLKKQLQKHYRNSYYSS